MQKLMVGLLFLPVAMNAFAYYMPGQGRWLSRDPVGDPAFYVVHSGKQISEPVSAGTPTIRVFDPKRNTILTSYAWRWDSTFRMNNILGPLAGGNLHAFVENDPIVGVDALGLLKFGKNCTAQQKADIQKAMNDICQKAKQNNCFRCLSKNGQSWMNGFCDNTLKGLSEPTIECDDQTTDPDCKGSCGNSFPGSRVIHLCFNNINNPQICPGMGCTIIHEATHGMAGRRGEVEAYGIEKCSGCTIPQNQPVPPGY